VIQQINHLIAESPDFNKNIMLGFSAKLNKKADQAANISISVQLNDGKR